MSPNRDSAYTASSIYNPYNGMPYQMQLHPCSYNLTPSHYTTSRQPLPLFTRQPPRPHPYTRSIIRIVQDRVAQRVDRAEYPRELNLAGQQPKEQARLSR